MSQGDLLGPLVDAIKTVRCRIDLGYEHREAFVSQEAQTRVSLIDPILIALGWDVANPAHVRSEFSVENRRADYALLADTSKEKQRPSVAVSIEAKSLDTNLDTRQNRDQMTLQVNDNGATHAVLTDGNIWKVYDFRPPGQSVQDRLRFTVDIGTDEIHESAFKLLLLWRPNIESGVPAEPGEPILGVPTSSDGPNPGLVEPPPIDANWIPLSDYSPQAGTEYPASIRFPDNVVRQLTSWRSIIDVVTQWLFDSSRLTPTTVPFRYGKSGGEIVNLTPTLRNNKPMQSYYQVPSQQVYVNAHGSRSTIVTRARAILVALSVDPNDVYIRIDE